MYELKVVRERRHGYGERKRITNSRDIYEVFQGRFCSADREEFHVVLLDVKNRVLGFNVVSVGTLTFSVIHPREVFKPAILANAAGMIVVHNHPSGDPEPSAEDREITNRLWVAGELLGIKMIDHIIIGDGRYLSFADDHLV